MPEGELTDALILAALDRAERHRRPPREDGKALEPGVVYSELVGHLGLVMGSATGRRLRPRLRELLAAGLVEEGRRHGVTIYALTRRGRRRLAAAGIVELPESPQHRRWRTIRGRAADRIGEFRDGLRKLLGEADALLVDEAAPSESWFRLSKELGDAAWRLGSATHCLREWLEPRDDAPDYDDGPNLGRRSTHLWGS